MALPDNVINLILTYGYLAVFIMVILQETGFPNPVPNELLLLFSGYLCHNGYMSLMMVIITAVTADFSGTCILYFLAYNSGSYILRKLSGWSPRTHQKLEKLFLRIKSGSLVNIFIFRCTPFTRGYVSVISGIAGIGPVIYLPLALITAVLWASFYILVGYFTGPSWDTLLSHQSGTAVTIIALCSVFLILLIFNHLSIKRKENDRTISPWVQKQHE